MPNTSIKHYGDVWIYMPPKRPQRPTRLALPPPNRPPGRKTAPFPWRRAFFALVLAAIAVALPPLATSGGFVQFQAAFHGSERSLQLQRDPTQWPFAATSPWNMPIATTASFEDGNGACTQAMTQPDIRPSMNTITWSHAVYQAGSRDPLHQVTIEYDPATNGPNTIQIHIPPNAVPSPPAASQGGDARMYIIDPTQHLVDEFWKMRPVGDGNWAARVHVQNDLYGSGVEAWGTRAYGGSGIGGLIRAGELGNGIHHAIAFAVPERLQTGFFVWPAIARDFAYPPSVYHGPIPMGQFVAIPPNVNLAQLHLSPQGLRFAQALQDYGGYVVDSSTDYSYYGDPPVNSELGGLPYDLPRIQLLLRCVTNNTAETVGGGGPDAPRLAPLAPPL